MGDGRERFRSPQDALGRLDDDPGLEHGSSPGENLRAHIASLTPFARLAPYSALPLFRALPALSLSGGGSVYTRIDPKFSSVNEDDIPSKQLIRLCPGPWALTLPGTWETIPVTVLLVSDETLPGVS